MTNTTIAVGESHLGASRVYGIDSTELLLVSYQEFDLAHGLDQAAALRLAAGDGLEEVLELAVGELEKGRDLELSVDYRAGADALRRSLAEHPGIGVTAVRQRATTVVVDLGRVPGSDSSSTEVVLAALDLALVNLPDTEPAPDASPAPSPAASPVRRTPRAGQAARPVRILNRLTVALGRLSQRNQLLALAALSVLVVALLAGALILIDRSSDSTDAVILVSITVAVQLLTGVLMLYVLRSQALERSTQQRLHRRTRVLVDRRTTQLSTQGHRIREDVAALNSLRTYVMELARLQAENTVRTEAAIARLQRGPADGLSNPSLPSDSEQPHPS